MTDTQATTIAEDSNWPLVKTDSVIVRSHCIAMGSDKIISVVLLTAPLHRIIDILNISLVLHCNQTFIKGQFGNDTGS